VERFGIDFAVRGLPEHAAILRVRVRRKSLRGAPEKVCKALSSRHLVGRVVQSSVDGTVGR
jgi:hypothetical protein